MKDLFEIEEEITDDIDLDIEMEALDEASVDIIEAQHDLLRGRAHLEALFDLTALISTEDVGMATHQYLIANQLHHIHQDMDIVDVCLEDLSIGDADSDYVLESIKNTIKKVWRAIQGFIQRLKTAIYKFFAGTRKQSLRLAKSMSDLRKDTGNLTTKAPADTTVSISDEVYQTLFDGQGKLASERVIELGNQASLVNKYKTAGIVYLDSVRVLLKETLASDLITHQPKLDDTNILIHLNGVLKRTTANGNLYDIVQIPGSGMIQAEAIYDEVTKGSEPTLKNLVIKQAKRPESTQATHVVTILPAEDIPQFLDHFTTVCNILIADQSEFKHIERTIDETLASGRELSSKLDTASPATVEKYRPVLNHITQATHATSQYQRLVHGELLRATRVGRRFADKCYEIHKAPDAT